MTAKFTDFADFISVPRRWINGLNAYAVGEGTVHLFVLGTTCSPIRVHLGHSLYVRDLSAKTNGDICRLFNSRQAWDANDALQVTLTADALVMTIFDGTLIPITSHGRLLTLPSDIVHHTPQNHSPLSPPSSLLATTNPPSLNVQQLWHARLGHISGRGITTLTRSGITDLPPQLCVLPFCRTCATIKSTVAPRPRGLHPKPTEPFKRCGWDFWRNNTTSLQGNSYSYGAIDYACSIVAL
jgi:hypothetical protein